MKGIRGIIIIHEILSPFNGIHGIVQFYIHGNVNILLPVSRKRHPVLPVQWVFSATVFAHRIGSVLCHDIHDCHQENGKSKDNSFHNAKM